jgi:hypothetical protein
VMRRSKETDGASQVLEDGSVGASVGRAVLHVVVGKSRRRLVHVTLKKSSTLRDCALY